MLLGLTHHTFIRPRDLFRQLRIDDHSLAKILFGYLLPLALIAPVAAFVGTTKTGWSVDGGELIRLSTLSGLKISVAYFAGIVVATLTVARFIQWMSETYGERQRFVSCLTLAVFSATPLYLAGAFQAYPVVWLNYVLGLPLLAYAIYLLHVGIEELFNIGRERALLFGGAVLAVGMVALVGLLVATVMLWQAGFAPQFV